MFSSEFKTTMMIRAFGFLKVPMILYCRPKVISINNSYVELKIPLRRRTKNHLNSLYFGVFAVGSDLTAGALAMRSIKKSNQKISLVFKDFHANFKMRAEGDVHFYCNEGEKIDTLVKKTVSSGSRENETINIFAKVPSVSNEIVAEFTETLSLKVL
tara:strand:+ start:11946 stop:12416 length:471 start_codon:yes stop_codon:yes gene_type:complete